MFSFFQSRPKYARISPQDPSSENEDPESALLSSSSSSSSSSSLTLKPPPPNQQSHEIRVAIKTLVLCSIVYLGAGLWLGLSMQTATFVMDADDFCMQHVSQYSPVVADVRPNWHTQQFNGSFLHENVYRQPAGPEVDAAWAALGVNYRSVVIPESEAVKAGLRPDQVKISQEYGGGFPANVEGLHHLHCLDLVRKTLHWNYDYYLVKKDGPFVNSEYIVRIHTTHCLDILRQVLMCNPDVGVLGQVWWQPEDEPTPMAFVDFNTKHRCRDFEGVRAWAEARQLPPDTKVNMTRFYEMPKPGDTVYAAIP